MAIIFLKKKNLQKILISVFILVLLITAIIIWRGFFQDEEGIISDWEILSLPRQKVEINYEVLASPFLEELESFLEIEPLPKEEIGRENPFIPY